MEMRSQILCLSVIVFLVVGFSGLAEAALPSDNFNDNSKGEMWNWYWLNGGPSTIWLDETNQRLEVRATSGTTDDTAVYGSVDWGVVTTEDFQMKIDFNHSVITLEGSGVFLTIIQNFDFLDFPETGNYISLGAGCDESYQIFWYERATNFIVDESDWKFRSSNTGTLYISYDSSQDKLYLSDTGYGSGNAWKTITGVLHGQWDRNLVGIGIGGTSEGVALSSGDAYLDNFVIDSGTWCTGEIAADLNEDCKVDFRDLALLALEWLDCNMDPSASCL